jgi:hypothetical protein
MKLSFVPYQRFAQGGQTFTDSDGCHYVKPQSHPALAGKEFCNELEFRQHVNDYNAAHPDKPFTGEVVLLPIFNY